MRVQAFVTQIRENAIAATLPLAMVALSPVAAQAIDFTGLYVFGDSLSDTGNLFRASGNLIPPPPYFNGRFSNGPLWVEDLAPKLGLTYTPQTNFAFAGATTGTLNTTVSVLPGLQQEVNGFAAAIPAADPNALYVVWAGANDYVGGGQTDPSIPVSNLATAIQTLVGIGAKEILVPNLPDLGKLAGPRLDPTTSAGLTLLSTAHNNLLAQTLGLLEPTLGSGVNLIPLDIYGLFNNVSANPTAFGFTNTTQSCLFPPPLQNPGMIFTVCSNPNQYLFWDDLHVTASAQALIGDLAFDTIQSEAVPEPSATAGLALAGAFLGAIATLKRKQHKLQAKTFAQELQIK